jgi:hypothetical protein
MVLGPDWGDGIEGIYRKALIGPEVSKNMRFLEEECIVLVNLLLAGKGLVYNSSPSEIAYFLLLSEEKAVQPLESGRFSQWKKVRS